MFGWSDFLTQATPDPIRTLYGRGVPPVYSVLVARPIADAQCNPPPSPYFPPVESGVSLSPLTLKGIRLQATAEPISRSDLSRCLDRRVATFVPLGPPPTRRVVIPAYAQRCLFLAHKLWWSSTIFSGSGLEPRHRDTEKCARSHTHCPTLWPLPDPQAPSQPVGQPGRCW